MRVPGRPEEGVGEAGGSSESEFSRDRSSTSARRLRTDSASGARLNGGDRRTMRTPLERLLIFTYIFTFILMLSCHVLYVRSGIL